MTPPDDVSGLKRETSEFERRTESIRGRVEDLPSDVTPSVTALEVRYLLEKLDQVGEALAATDARTVFAFLDRVEEDAGTELMRALGQVRDVALKRDYDAALRDAAQEGAE